jgi:uncharacterized SAM-binding protein YcdF (DUF218 family)
MSLLLGKLAAQLVLPLAAALALMALALVCLALRRARAAGLLLAAALAGLWLASTPVLAEKLAASLERAHLAPPLAALAPADAILLLGGGTQRALPPREFPEVTDAGDRVLHAARLFHAGKAPVVVVSSGRLPWQTRGAAEAEGMSELLAALGVPREAIVREEQSANTRDNCVFSKALLDARGARDVLLVTSALHMRRALATCRAAGLAVRPAPTDFWVADEGPRSWLDLAPDPEALAFSHAALRERIGFLVYQRRGWIAPQP